MPRPIQHRILQNLAAYLLSEQDQLDWRMESFTLSETVGIRPTLTAEAVVMGYEVRLCARAWGTGFRLALRINFGTTTPTSPDGHHAPPGAQREPNVVTPSLFMSWEEAESHATVPGAWRTPISTLFRQAQQDLATASGLLHDLVTARHSATRTTEGPL